jgi:hypothetical protein
MRVVDVNLRKNIFDCAENLGLLQADSARWSLKPTSLGQGEVVQQHEVQIQGLEFASPVGMLVWRAPWLRDLRGPGYRRWIGLHFQSTKVGSRLLNQTHS